jgi:outer membrane protein, heavy metal efflux system
MSSCPVPIKREVSSDYAASSAVSKSDQMRTGTNPKSIRRLEVALSIALLPNLIGGCATVRTASIALSSATDSIVGSPSEQPADSRLSEPEPRGPLEGQPSEANLQPMVKLTLNQVIYSAIREHPAVAAQFASVSQARADWLTTSLLPNPDLFTDAQLLPLTRPFTVTRQGGPPQQDVIVSYPIDWFLFGKRVAAMQTAHAGIHVAQYEYEDVIRRRIIEASDAFFTLVATQELSKAAEEIVRNLEQLERATDQAVKDGGKPAVDLSRIRIDLLGARQQLTILRAEQRIAQARVASLMGRSDLAGGIIVEFDLEQPAERYLIDSATAYQVAIATRPDILRLRWLATQSEQNLFLQQRLAKPHVTPALGYTRQYQEKAIGFPDANSWGASVTMSLPVHDRNQGNIAKAASIQRQTLWEIESLQITINEEINATLAQLDGAQSVAESVANEQLKLASQVRDSISESFQSGGRPLIDLLDAQKKYRDTLSLYYTTRANYWKARYRLVGVLGQELPEAAPDPPLSD